MRQVLAAGGVAAVFAIAILSGFLLAQNAELDRLRLQSLQQQNMQAQEQQNTLRRADADLAQALSDQHRQATEQNLRASRPVGVAPAPVPGPVTSDNEALRRLQDAELAAGNARLRAITPAAR